MRSSNLCVHISKIKHCNHRLKSKETGNTRSLSSIASENVDSDIKFKASKDFLHNPTQHVQFFDWLAKKYNLKSPDDWYKLNTFTIMKHGGTYILQKYYNNSLAAALQAVYPHFSWQPWKFQHAPKRFWEDKKNHREFFDWVAGKLGIKSLEDWYSIKPQDVFVHGGRGLVQHYYNASVAGALQAVYPEFDWCPWKFATGIPKNYWNRPEHVKKFFTWAEKELDIQTKDDWYNVTCKHLERLGGHALVDRFNLSMYNAMITIYPEHTWLAWKFASGVPNGFWDHEENIRSFLDYLMKEYEINTVHDLNITLTDLHNAGGLSLTRKYKGIRNLLKRFFPEYSVPETTSKGQLRLYTVIKSIFPNENVMANYKLLTEGKSTLELDIYIPNLNLGFEYQGEYHYQWSFLYGAPEEVQKRDQKKKEMCKNMNINLIDIPYWWDRSRLSVMATIHQQRPDILPHVDRNAKPISMTVFPAGSRASAARQQMKREMTDIEFRQFEQHGSYMPYLLSFGSHKGRCSACKQEIHKSELRVQAHGVFVAADTKPYKVKYNLCLKDSCLEKTSKLTGGRVFFPVFNSSIGIPQQVKERMEQENLQTALSSLQNVKWFDM